jgi:peroxiredoxin Q/BCP
MKKIVIFILLLVSVLLLSFKISDSTMKKIEVGDKVPTFNLKDQNGKLFTVNDKMGKSMVIYFYPKDDTPGCTKEACKFRDNFEVFTNLGALVIGISADSVESHKNFIEKYNLPFTLLADINNEVRNQFGVPKSMFLIPGRVTYVVDSKGYIQYIFNSQFNSEKHIENSLTKLKALQNSN